MKISRDRYIVAHITTGCVFEFMMKRNVALLISTNAVGGCALYDGAKLIRIV